MESLIKRYSMCILLHVISSHFLTMCYPVKKNTYVIYTLIHFHISKLSSGLDCYTVISLFLLADDCYTIFLLQIINIMVLRCWKRMKWRTRMKLSQLVAMNMKRVRNSRVRTMKELRQPERIVSQMWKVPGCLWWFTAFAWVLEQLNQFSPNLRYAPLVD